VTFTSTHRLDAGNRRATGKPISRPKMERVTVSNSTKSKFPELLQLKLPRGTNTALDELASKLHRSKSEIVRQAIMRYRAKSPSSARERGLRMRGKK
jgi:hypothetical protein